MSHVYATGFNAHNQLAANAGNSQPEDVRSWTKIASGGGDCRVLFAGWSSTVLLIDQTLVLQGHTSNESPRSTPLKLNFPHAEISSSSEIRSVHGDLNGPLGLLTWTGHLYAFEFSSTTSSPSPTLTRVGDTTSPTLSHIVISGTGRTAAIMLQARGSRMIHILSFPTYSTFQSWFLDPSGDKTFEHHMLGGRAVTLLGGATAFVMLTEEGEVFSWGDGRHSSCLGRVPDAESPPEKPGVVGALGGIKIKKIDGCGWVFGALSESGDLYLWGRDKPGGDLEDGGLGALFGGPDEEVKLLEGEQFEDVSDFAVGNGHTLVGTPRGEIWGIGGNGNGQLGLGTRDIELVRSWTRAASVRPGAKLELATGDLSSFVVSDQELG